MLYRVITASRSAQIGNGLTYEADRADIVAGSLVSVPLRNQLVEGIVAEVIQKRAEQEFDVKQIKDILGAEPLLSDAQIRTAQWMSEYYLCSQKQALSLFLPPQPWASVLPKKKTSFRLSTKDQAARGKKQQAVLDALRSGNWMTDDELKTVSGASSSTILSLLEKNQLESKIEVEDFAFALPTAADLHASPSFTDGQTSAYNEITSDKRPALLFGITGSGKTEIYAALIADAVRAGKQSILLVPEILLTEHIIERFEALLPRERIAIVHSKLTESQERDTWKRIHRGEVALVIGSRSALFSPVRNLGLVIVDEEHEWTYKNEQTPRYHVRETAQALCRLSGARLLFGTATPSLETWAKTKSGEYLLSRLPERFNGNTLPVVRIVDLATAKFGSSYPLTLPLLDAIQDRLQKKEQSVLFLNHRGMASALLCLQCRRRVVSPASQLPFTVHRQADGASYLLDHTTGVRATIPDSCPHCGSANLKEVGAGTQRIEVLLQKHFPTARLLRADADTLSSIADMQRVLATMRNGEADILLGTQSVVKGLDLPQVTLAAVLVADVGLSLPHFRAGERIFQLLTQLTGRSGRAKPGEVIIQTFRPDAPEITRAALHQTEEFLETELKMRVYSKYPPAMPMIRLLTRGDDAAERAHALQRQIAVAKSDNELIVSSGPTFFSGGKEWQLLLRGSQLKELLKKLNLDHVSIDIDPVETL